MAAPSQYYVDYGAGNDTTGNGTSGTPWKTVQKALDTVTRDTTNGDQININSSTAQVLSAALSLTTYGAPGATAPLILRGYTASSGDGGVGEIDCNGVTMFASSTLRYIVLVGLKIHNFGNNNGVYLSSYLETYAINCEIYKGASSPTSKTLVYLAYVIGCHVHDAGTTGVGISGFGGLVYGNFVNNCVTATNHSGFVLNNVLANCTTGTTGASVAAGNSVYASSGSTGTGVALPARAIGFNNIIEGFSGSGGKGLSTVDALMIGYNAFYNNATAESLGDTWIDLGNDGTPAASPFTNAGSLDFSLVSSAGSGVLETAMPSAFGSATTNKADRGAVQAGAGAGGGSTVIVIED
ncbi:MAG: hypothetical protein IPK44_01515 [Candidatus Accumulibacter sp.]|uniref:hypothetical protein n=1 Tax=Accumulibacter sp. TaxID=2053492 RepID=UPI002584CC7B|nr:hypothetical protein [Accumulibacter sp.]MBK8113206.1 hypothetical protein [Accumulibacter sp.]MBK8113278.1 hypothetical protein [Accumulibacter sp.]